MNGVGFPTNAVIEDMSAYGNSKPVRDLSHKLVFPRILHRIQLPSACGDQSHVETVTSS